MATLFNTKISATYEGLLKTIDNVALSATLRQLSDGSGNGSGLYLNTAGDFKVTSILEWGSLKDTGTGVTITRYVTSTDGIENFDNNTSLPTTGAVKLYVDTKFATSDTLQEVLVFGNTTSGNDIAVSAGDDITFTDSSKAIFGAGSDLQIYHDGSSSYIKDVGTGDLRIWADNPNISTLSGNKYFYGNNGSAELYYTGNKKFETTTTGVTITGRLSGLTNPTLAQDAATKSYVDDLDAGSDLDITDGTTAGAVNLNTQSLSILGTTNEIDSVVSGQSVTIGLPTSISTNLVGNVTGNVTGNLTGNVTATSVLADGVTATTQASSDNSTKVATTEFVKSLDNASDLDFSGNTGAGAVTLNSQSLAISGITNEIVTTAANQGLTVGFPTAGVTLPNGSVATTQASSDDSTKIATTAYVKSLDNASDLDFSGTTGTGDVNLNTQSFAISGTANQITTAASNQGLEISLLSTGVTMPNNSVATTQSAGDDSTKIATTEYVDTSAGLYLPLAGGTMTGNTIHNNSVKSIYGTLSYAEIYHDASDFYTKNTVGNLYIDQAAITESIFFRVSDANALDVTALTISRNGDLTTGRNVTIAGDLTVNGTTTTVNSQTLSVVDPLIQLAKANTANSLDIGLYGDYNDGTGRYLGLFSDASDGNKFKLFKGTTIEPTTTVNISGAGYEAADLQVAGLEATNFVSTDITIADYIYHAGDADTYFGFPSNNNFKVTIGGNDNITGNINAVSLKYGGILKLITTSSGISVSGGGAFQTAISTGSTGTIGTPKIIMQADGTLDWGAAKDYGTLSWDTGYALITGQSGKGIKFATNGSTLALTLDTSQNATFAGKVMLGSGTPVRKLELRTITGARNFGIGFNDKDGNQQATTAIDHNTNDLITASTANIRFYSGSTIGGIATLPTNQTLQLDASQNARFTATASANIIISRDNMFVNAGQFYIGAENGTTDDTYRQSVGSGIFKIESRESGTWTNRFQINNSGSSTFAGTIATGNMTISGQEIDVSSGDLTLDVAGDIVLNADGGDVNLADGGTFMGRLGFENGDLNIASTQQDYDIRLKGNDGGTIITALHLDMSEGGNATFAGEVTISAETQYLNFKKASSNDLLSTIVSETDAGTGGKLRFLTKRNGDTQLNALTLDDNQQAFFGDSVHIQEGKGYYMDTVGALGSNFVKTINSFETVIGTDRGSAAFGVFGNSGMRFGFGTSYTDAQTKIIINQKGDIYNATQTNTYQSTFFGINTGNQLLSTGLYNQGFGYEVNPINTTGEKNTGMGHRALYNSTTSSRNTAIGYQTLYNLNAAGSDNTAIGYAAGSSLQNAERNIFVGGFCGASTSTGASYNTALGYSALRYAETNQNTAIGYFAMGTSTSVTGGLNTAIGIRSQEDLTSGVNNCALGADSLPSVTTGSNNIGIGYKVLGDLTVGQANVCIGREAGYGGDFGETVFIGNYAGQNNTQSTTVGIGAQALQNNTGAQNTAVGYQALITNRGGVRNTALGYKALDSNNGGDANTAIGNEALGNVNADRNVAIGDRAGLNITTGSANIAIGYLALSGGTGSHCVAIGDNALSSDGTFEESVAVGDSALQTQQSGRNHAFGFHALQDLISGNYNTAVGGESAENITTGSNNTSLGAFALRFATDSSGQTAVGYQALYTSNGNGNVGMGQQAGYSLTTGTFNVIVGHECGFGLTDGSDNILIGDRAGRLLASGNDNVFIGTQSAYNRTSGSENTFVGEKANGIGVGTGNNNAGFGRYAGYALTGGAGNTMLGHQSGIALSSGSNNTLVGKDSGGAIVTGFENIALGKNALVGLATGSGGIAIGIGAGNFTSGNGNIALGYGANGSGAVTGDRNICIGDATGYNITGGGNNILIGTNAGRTGSQTPQSLEGITSSSDQIQLGNNSHNSFKCKIALTVTSDKRDKTNLKEIPLGLDFVSQLKPTSFEFKKDRESNEADGIERYGFLAQEILELEGDKPVIIDNENLDSLKYTSDHLIPVMVKAIQELTVKVEKLESTLSKCKCNWKY